MSEIIKNNDKIRAYPEDGSEAKDLSMRKTTIRDALLLWKKHAHSENHLNQSRLDNTAKGYGSPEDFDHIAKCPTCMGKVWQRIDRVYSDMDEVILLVAARGTDRPEVRSQGKKYHLELTSLVDEPKASALTVTVISSECKKAIEGRIIRVIEETSGRTLLRGRVIDGKVTKKVKNLDRLERLRIEVEEDEEDKKKGTDIREKDRKDKK